MHHAVNYRNSLGKMISYEEEADAHAVVETQHRTVHRLRPTLSGPVYQHLLHKINDVLHCTRLTLTNDTVGKTPRLITEYVKR